MATRQEQRLEARAARAEIRGGTTPVERQREARALAVQEQSEQKEAAAAEAQARAAKRAAREERSPVQDVVDYVELAGVLALLYFLRRPIEKVLDWVLKKMRVHAEILEDKARIAEMEARQRVVETYLLDPIYGPKIGGNMYTQLVLEGGWTSTYYKLTEPPPARMAPQFVVGSGPGTEVVTAEIIHMFAIEAEALFRWLVVRGKIE